MANPITNNITEYRAAAISVGNEVLSRIGKLKNGMNTVIKHKEEKAGEGLAWHNDNKQEFVWRKDVLSGAKNRIEEHCQDLNPQPSISLQG